MKHKVRDILLIAVILMAIVACAWWCSALTAEDTEYKFARQRVAEIRHEQEVEMVE